MEADLFLIFNVCHFGLSADAVLKLSLPDGAKSVKGDRRKVARLAVRSFDFVNRYEK
jgi:hypothetical protein